MRGTIASTMLATVSFLATILCFSGRCSCQDFWWTRTNQAQSSISVVNIGAQAATDSDDDTVNSGGDSAISTKTLSLTRPAAGGGGGDGGDGLGGAHGADGEDASGLDGEDGEDFGTVGGLV